MRDLMKWEVFTREDGTVDPDKGSVLTMFNRETGEPHVTNLSRQETALFLGSMALTSDFLAKM